MRFLTGFFPREYADNSAYCSFVYNTIRRKGGLPIVFACVWRKDAGFGPELWREWLRHNALPLCKNAVEERCADKVMESFLEFRCGSENDLLENISNISDIAVFFSVGEECFYAWQGSVDIKLLNICFNKVHIKSLTVSSDKFMYTRVRLEPEVGILLGSRSFFAQLPEHLLKECLAVGEMSGQAQAERHLYEAAEAAERLGPESVAAAIVVAAQEQSGAFLELIHSNGYVSPIPIGRGAFGSVYKVRDEKKRCNIACKTAEGVTARKLLRREAKLQEMLEHPLFASYVGCAEGECETVLFMEYVKGRNLGDVLRKGPLSQRKAVLIARQLAEGLSYLHNMPEPVIYRDLKPDNIQLDLKGKVKLLDLGCACALSDAGKSRAGSRGYAAPEQLDLSGVCGFYSDVYALGKVMQKMLDGAEVSGDMERFITKCIDITPDKRPQSMEQVLKELEKFE